MSKLDNQFYDLYSRYSIYRILTIERIQQKYQHNVDPAIHKPNIREDLATYVNSLLPEFDYALEFRKVQKYYPILFMRRTRKHARLTQWMNKIWIGEYLKKLGVPILERYYMSYADAPPAELLDTYSRYVAKPAHMSEGDSVYVVANGRDIKSGQAVDSQIVSNKLAEAMSLKTVSWDTWGTRNSTPGVVVEAMSANSDGCYSSMPDEIKIYCVWGKVYFGVWRRHTEYQHGGFLYRDSPNPALLANDHTWWNTMIEVAEHVAAGTDFLRVDMFVNGGRPVVSEVEIMPATPVPRTLQAEIEMMLNRGYGYHESVLNQRT